MQLQDSTVHVHCLHVPRNRGLAITMTEPITILLKIRHENNIA